MGIGSVLFKESMDWLSTFKDIKDVFIFVSSGNDNALKFYLGKGFKVKPPNTGWLYYCIEK
jgi:hypothetical protein